MVTQDQKLGRPNERESSCWLAFAAVQKPALRLPCYPVFSYWNVFSCFLESGLQSLVFILSPSVRNSRSTFSPAPLIGMAHTNDPIFTFNGTLGSESD